MQLKKIKAKLYNLFHTKTKKEVFSYPYFKEKYEYHLKEMNYPKIEINYSSGEYRLYNKNGGYYFYINFNRQRPNEDFIILDIVDEQNEDAKESLRMFYKIPENINFVETESIQWKGKMLPKKIKFYAKNKMFLGELLCMTEDTFGAGLTGSLYFSKEFVPNKIYFKPVNEEYLFEKKDFLEWNNYKDLFDNKRYPHQMRVNSFYLNFLETIIKS